MNRSGPLSGITAAALSRATGVGAAELNQLAEESAAHYRPDVREIGGKKRDLHIPQGRLREVQRRLLRTIFSNVPAHRYSAAVAGRGALWAARQHAGRPYLLHLDIENFYPSVSQDRVFARLSDAGASNPVAWLLSRLTTLPARLPQGACTSAAVAELVLYPLDCRLTGLTKGKDLRFTRYADDLAFSGDSVLTEIRDQVVEIAVAEGWKINGKGGLAGPGESREVLGLSVSNPSPSVPRVYVRRIRDDLRKIRAGIVVPSKKELDSLKGRVNYVRATRPSQAKALGRLLEDALSTASVV